MDEGACVTGEGFNALLWSLSGAQWLLSRDGDGDSYGYYDFYTFGNPYGNGFDNGYGNNYGYGFGDGDGYGDTDGEGYGLAEGKYV